MNSQHTQRALPPRTIAAAIAAAALAATAVTGLTLAAAPAGRPAASRAVLAAAFLPPDPCRACTPPTPIVPPTPIAPRLSGELA